VSINDRPVRKRMGRGRHLFESLGPAQRCAPCQRKTLPHTRLGNSRVKIDYHVEFETDVALPSGIRRHTRTR